MCGIAGFVNLDGAPADVAIACAMADSLAHRGPDGEGQWSEEGVALGHRRLAILDLSPAGSQPMATEDRRFVLVYNGELYNYRELRSDLERSGRRFRSSSDTEVVLQALAEWGTDALLRFNGMFGLALWDRDRRELLLARDRFGVKPLYWCRRGDTLLFASEIKAMLVHPALRPQMDRETLVEYLTFQNVFTDRTLFKDVRLLPHGSFLRVPATGPPGTPTQYWDFDFSAPDEFMDAGEAVEELDRRFAQAVERQLVSDVPVSSYLSGGMDSGSITAVASARLPDMRTFTVGFDLSSASGLELGFDERRAAERMSYQFSTEHYEMVLKAGDMERVMPRLVHSLEDLRVGQSYPNYYAAQLASKFGKVVLSGTGGDELFAGYPWRYYRAVANADFEDYIDKYYLFWQRLLPNTVLHKLLGPIWSDVSHVRTRDIMRDVFSHHAQKLSRPEDYINHSLYLEAKTFLQGLLVVDDKLSMAHGLETRVPFLDNDLVDFAQSVPVALKLANLGEAVRINENEPAKDHKYFMRANDGKLILRRAMQRHVREEVAEREKQGFSGPDATWFRGESIDYVRRTLLDPQARIYEFLDRRVASELIDDHLEGRENRRLLIWSLLSLEQWCRTFVG